MAFSPSSLRHLVVAVIGMGATLLGYSGILQPQEVMYIYLFILGYALKNGYQYANGKKANN